MKHTFTDDFEFRGARFSMTITAEYDRDGYFDILELEANGRKVSDRFIFKFQGEHWDYLYSKCIEHSNNMAEMYRDERIDCVVHEAMMSRF